MNKWAAKLDKMVGMITEDVDPFQKIVRSPSPSVNFIFGKTHGLPRGYSMVLYGPPKGGKSVLSHFIIGQIQKDDPDAMVLKIDTELRAKAQLLTPQSLKLFGIERERMRVMFANQPGVIFDQIEQNVAVMCEGGMPLHAIVIDSLNGIQGRREMNNDSVEKVTIGDHALTVQTGLKRILPVIRKYDIALIIVDQVRAEMDMWEQKRGNKFKMQSSYGTQHGIEYFVCVEENLNADGRKDILGNEMVNNNAKDLSGKEGKGQATAKKIKVKMKASTMAGETQGRTGEFTFHYRKGIVNVHEEVYLLGTRRGIIKKPKQGYYEYDGQTWHGEAKCLQALEADSVLREHIIDELRRRDDAGEYDEDVERDEEAVEE
jgi:hypothetical protein